MKKTLSLLFIIIMSFPIIPAEYAGRLCLCLQEAAISPRDKKKKAECQDMRENIESRLGKGSTAFREFEEEIEVCESRLSAKPEKPGSLSYDQMIEDVCRCVHKSYSNRSERAKCRDMQSEYSRTMDEGSSRQKNFLNQTNICF